MESSRIGYSSAGKNNDYIVIFEVSLPHNLHRLVKFKWTALYRCKKAFPLMIFHKETGKKVEEVESSDIDGVIFKIHNFVMVDYDYNDSVDGRGIYFYLSREPAYFHNYTPKSGYISKWDNDGCPLYKIIQDDVTSKLKGRCVYYHENNDVPKIIKYIESGLIERYDESGNIIRSATYKNGKLHGLLIKYINNIINFSCEYKDGLKHGTHITYDNLGMKNGEFTYENDVLNGPFKLWENQKIKVAGNVVDGNLEGIYKFWRAEGNKIAERYNNNKLVSTIYSRKLKTIQNIIT